MFHSRDSREYIYSVDELEAERKPGVSLSGVKLRSGIWR